MQRGIDSYFKTLPSTPKSNGTDVSPLPKRKRQVQIISSDEEEEFLESPQSSRKLQKKVKIDKISDNVQGKSFNKPTLSKLENSAISLPSNDHSLAFVSDTNLRVNNKISSKPKNIVIQDHAVEKSKIETDISINSKNKVKSKNLMSPISKKLNLKEMKTIIKLEENNISPTKEDKKNNRISYKTPIKKKEKEHSIEKELKKIEKLSPPVNKNKKVKELPKQESKAKKDKITKAPNEPVDLETSIRLDEERHERKRMTAILYQKFKNRSSCLNPGSKEVPKGKPNCLAGFSFLVTGVLESLERDEASSIIKEYGGKVMTTVGKRLNYLVVGEDAGPKKLVQAEEYNVKILSEDSFFDLIREKSGIICEKDSQTPTKLLNKNSSNKGIEQGHSQDQDKIQKINKSPPKKHKVKNSHNVIELNSNKKVKEEIKKTISHVSIDETKRDNTDLLPWVEKYKPTSVKDIVGQQGEGSNVGKLSNWLAKWYVNHDGKKKLQKPNPWAKNDDGSYFKAALLSGPPGIGKTTTATLVCKELGFDTVEFNASDTRNKRLLKEEVSELISNKSLHGYISGNGQAVSKKHVLLMDEVDGMAGNEDRGGIQELIGLIKESCVPIICMCNDRNHQKMRSLVNYCYDLRFQRPRLVQIKGYMMSILFKEKIKLDSNKVADIISSTNNDIRQSINHLSLLSTNNGLKNVAEAKTNFNLKDLKLGPWEVIRKVFSADEHKNMTFTDKTDLFFHDYSLSPLFVQQNYLQVSPSGPKSEVTNKIALTADALSWGDLIEKNIRSNSAWSLLPTQAIFSSVLPGEYMCGHFTGQINFPGWLGKNSRHNKRNRLAQEIHDHTRIRTSGSRLSIRLDYAPFLLSKVVSPLCKGLAGVAESLGVLKEYHLLREDIDSLMELSAWPGKKSLMDSVDGRVKAALTRAYNKEVLAYSYSVGSEVKKKRAEALDSAEVVDFNNVEEDGYITAIVSDEENDDDTLENDGLIKAKKKKDVSELKPTSKSSSKVKNSLASTSKSKVSSKSKK